MRRRSRSTCSASSNITQPASSRMARAMSGNSLIISVLIAGTVLFLVLQFG